MKLPTRHFRKILKESWFHEEAEKKKFAKELSGALRHDARLSRAWRRRLAFVCKHPEDFTEQQRREVLGALDSVLRRLGTYRQVLAKHVPQTRGAQLLETQIVSYTTIQ